jgi:hypothetical protein
VLVARLTGLLAHARLVVLLVVLATLLLAGLTTLLFLTVELDGAPALLGVLVVLILHPVCHCWLLSTTLSSARTLSRDIEMKCNGHTTDEISNSSSGERL